jgi:hypothetical protein
MRDMKREKIMWHTHTQAQREREYLRRVDKIKGIGTTVVGQMKYYQLHKSEWWALETKKTSLPEITWLVTDLCDVVF